MLFLFRTFKVALLLFHLLHFIDTFLLFPGKALYFIEVNLSDFSFSKDFRLLLEPEALYTRLHVPQAK